jgi:hypothetical protein
MNEDILRNKVYRKKEKSDSVLVVPLKIKQGDILDNYGDSVPLLKIGLIHSNIPNTQLPTPFFITGLQR